MSGGMGPHLSGTGSMLLPGSVNFVQPPSGAVIRPGMMFQSGPSSLLKPDPRVPDTLGWREWVFPPGWDRLMSPVQNTAWPSSHLTAETWTDEGGVRGFVGIHAYLVPKHWKVISELNCPAPYVVTGIVERFGRYVLGTEGWRAEQVVIRELLAPSTEIGLKLEQAYPDVIVHYPDQNEGESKWTSAASSELERGSLPLLPSSVPAKPEPPPPPVAPAFQNVTMPLTQTIVSHRSPNMILSVVDPSPSRLERVEKFRLPIVLLATAVGLAIGELVNLLAPP